MSRLLVFSLGLAGLIAFAAYWDGTSALMHPYKWFILAFLIVISALSYQALRRVTARRPDNWVGPYLGIITLRLLASIAFIACFVLTRIPNLYLFVANFFIFYLCFTGFEIYGLLANLRRNSTSK